MKQTHFKEEVIHYSFLILLFVSYDLFLCSLVLISSLSEYHFESLPCACKQSSCDGFTAGRLLLCCKRRLVVTEVAD
jgi:hypothetical protein